LFRLQAQKIGNNSLLNQRNNGNQAIQHRLLHTVGKRLVVCPLPGGSRASQNDVWVLGESSAGLISIAVEGKVSEPFGPTVGEWFKNKTTGKEKRLQFLCNELGFDFSPPPKVRYQLLHRTVSAILEAKRFRTNEAVMVVHTFSTTDEWTGQSRAAFERQYLSGSFYLYHSFSVIVAQPLSFTLWP